MMDRDPLPSPVSGQKRHHILQAAVFLIDGIFTVAAAVHPALETDFVEIHRQGMVRIVKVRATSAMPMGRRPLLLTKITSSILVPRRYLTLCSP